MPLKTSVSTCALFVSLTLCCAISHAEDAFIVGVGTHLMNYETSPVKALQMVSDAGITAVKDDAYWSTAEPAANQLRIVVLYFVLVHRAQWFVPLHTMVFPGLFVVLGLICFTLWMPTRARPHVEPSLAP